jgi:hypothetical protein
MSQNRHLIVFLAFQQEDIIKKSFDSVYDESFDYFIVENISENSIAIRNYFEGKKQTADNLVGYIQFQQNISATSIDCFLVDFDSLIKQYEYLTITDGDFFMYDIKNAMDELVLAFNNPRCVVSSIPLYLENNYDRGEHRVVGTDIFLARQKERQSIPLSHYEGITSNCFLTYRTSQIDFLKSIHYIDVYIHNAVLSMGGQWLVCGRNQSYHLTWDLYFDGNPYYEWKKAVIGQIWDRMPIVNYSRFF